MAGKMLGRLVGKSDESIDNVHRVIDEAQVHTVFQPLVDLRTQQVFAYEALARPNLSLFSDPPSMFDAAIAAHRVGELGRMLRRQAVDGCTTHPLFINIHPTEFDEPHLVQPDEPVFWHEEAVFLEITESVPLHYFEQCHAVLREARDKGMFLAVDDLGAGYSNLKYISDLEPEIVKLDRELIAGLQQGTRLFTLVKAIVSLCQDLGARVVAEGIEEPEELANVIAAGADIGQGYLLARPASVPPQPFWPDDVDPLTP